MTSGIVIIFVIFALLQREDLRNRLIKLGGVAMTCKRRLRPSTMLPNALAGFLSIGIEFSLGPVIGTGRGS
jgi:hypothetical protein